MTWEQLITQRDVIMRFGYAFFVLAVVVAALDVPFDALPVSGLSSVAVILALLGTHAFGVVPLLERIAELQATLEMREFVMEHSSADNVVVLRPGDTHTFEAPTGELKLRAHTPSKLEVVG